MKPAIQAHNHSKMFGVLKKTVLVTGWPMRPEYAYRPRNAMLDPHLADQGEIIPQGLPYSAGDSSVIHRYDEYSIWVEKGRHGLKGLKAPTEVVKRFVEH